MIRDGMTGIKLIPGNHGRDCPGNGEHFDKKGRLLECCCDGCPYYICCFEEEVKEMLPSYNRESMLFNIYSEKLDSMRNS